MNDRLDVLRIVSQDPSMLEFTADELRRDAEVKARQLYFSTHCSSAV